MYNMYMYNTASPPEQTPSPPTTSPVVRVLLFTWPGSLASPATSSSSSALLSLRTSSPKTCPTHQVNNQLNRLNAMCFTFTFTFRVEARRNIRLQNAVSTAGWLFCVSRNIVVVVIATGIAFSTSDGTVVVTLCGTMVHPFFMHTA